MEFRLGETVLRLDVPFTQQHFAENMLAALVAYRRPRAAARARPGRGLHAIRLSRWRGEEIAVPGGGFRRQRRLQREPDVDAGGAARPGGARGGRRRVAVLGEMAELGDDADRYHRAIGDLVAETVDVLVVAVGEQARLYMAPGVSDDALGRRTPAALGSARWRSWTSSDRGTPCS